MSPKESYLNAESKREGALSALLFAVVLLVFWRAFSNGLSVGHDMETHYYRIAQLLANIQEGEPLSQWSRYLMRGYGYPILMFYAPLFYWVVAIVELLIGNLSVAIRIVVLGQLFLAGWGTYRLSRRYLEPAGAFVAGIGYLFAPYILYDATDRGAFPELFGLVMIPFVLASLDDLLEDPTRRRYLKTTGLLTITLLSHNIVPFFVFPLMGLFTVIRLLLETDRPWLDRLNTLWVSGLVVLFGLGLTSMYWLPALIELEYTLSRVGGSTLYEWPYYEAHFLGLGDALTWPLEPIDSGLANRPLVRTLSVSQAFLSGVAVLLLVFDTHRRRWAIWGWVLVGLLSVYLMHSISKPVWVMLNLPDFIQLPSRMLGLSSLATAILSGYTLHRLLIIGRNRLPSNGVRWGSPVLIGAFTLGVAFTGWPWMYPIYSDVTGSPTIEEIVGITDWRDETGKVPDWGGASLGETLPMWVDSFPPSQALYTGEGAAADMQRLRLPESAVLMEAESFPSGDRYVLELSEPANLIYQTFYFPGWRLQINGEREPISITDPHGLISFELPEGRHDVSIRFGRTPLRIGMWLVAAGFALLLTLSLRVPWLTRASETVLSYRIARFEPLPLFLAVGLLIGFEAIIDRSDTFLRADRLLPDGRLTRVDTETQISFSQEFMHLGYSGPETVRAGETFEVVQYWRSLRGIGVPYGFGLRVADDQGRVWSTAEVGRPASYAGYPGRFGWSPETYVRDAYLIDLAPGIPPGEYWLEAEAFQRHVAFALQPDRQNGVDPAQARIGKIVVRADTGQPADLQVQTVERADLGRGLILEGWSLRTGIWRPGDPGALDLLWRSEATPTGGESRMGTILLLNDVDETVASHPFEIGNGYSIGNWRADQLVRDKLQWVLPAGLPTGELTVALLVDEERVELGTIPAEAPDRIFEPPAFAQAVDRSIDFARLLGYDVELDGEVMRLTLHWEAAGETDESYRVFVHFRNSEQVIRAQSDAVPAEWTRPTSGWLTGEIISDRHTLFLPADLESGTYEFYIGLYDQRTGERLGELSLGEQLIE